jgi:predicted alpha/beta superfamily hydrolase
MQVDSPRRPGSPPGARLSVLLAASVVVASAVITASQEKPGAAAERVTLNGTRVHTITSKALPSSEFRISVSLPWSYQSSQKRYPVVYVTDADTGFALAYAAYQAIQLDGEIPELILVGIGYGVDFTNNGFSTWSLRRSAELTPTAVKGRPGTGDAPRFVRFLQDELLPFIDANYRTQPDDRTIVGGSFGGLFAAYTMLRHPGLFQQFIVRSPSLWWDDRMMFGVEGEYAAAHKDLPVTVYTSLGTLETELMRSSWRDFVRVLGERHYPGLRLIVGNMEDARHATAIGMSLYPALKAVFGGTPVDFATLDRYAGRYVFPTGDTLVVSRSDTSLVAAWNGEPDLKLAARTPTRFSFTTGQDELASGDAKLLPLVGLERVDFTLSAAGSADSVVLSRDGHSFTGTRAHP